MRKRTRIHTSARVAFISRSCVRCVSASFVSSSIRWFPCAVKILVVVVVVGELVVVLVVVEVVVDQWWWINEVRY